MVKHSDRYITDFNDIVEMVAGYEIVRIAVNDGETPYIVPMNFGHEVVNDQLVLYLHGANEGKKIDLWKKAGKVAFEMDGQNGLVLKEAIGNCTIDFTSVMGVAEVEFVPEEEKYNALKCIMAHYGKPEFKFATGPIPMTSVIKLTVTEMTAKRRFKPDHVTEMK